MQVHESSIPVADPGVAAPTGRNGDWNRCIGENSAADTKRSSPTTKQRDC